MHVQQVDSHTSYAHIRIVYVIAFIFARICFEQIHINTKTFNWTQT